MVFKRIVGVMCLAMCSGVLHAGEVTPPSTPKSCVPSMIVREENIVELEERLCCSHELARRFLDLYVCADLYLRAQQEYIISLESEDVVGADIADRVCRQFPKQLLAAFDGVAAVAIEGTAAFKLIDAVRSLLLPGRVLENSCKIDPIEKLHELYAVKVSSWAS